MQRQAQQLKVGLNSFSLFGTMPTAEKYGLAGMVIALTIGYYFTGDYSVSITLAAANYLYQKYEQDKVVKAYYKEIDRANSDCYEINRIYRESPNVKAMGGKDAIDNTCATRVFCR